jgi:hypothetical protein
VTGNVGGIPSGNPWDELGLPNKKIHTDFGWFWNRVCWEPQRQPVLIVVYLVAFTVIAAFVMFSCFIGAVTGGMADAMDEFKEQEEKDKAKKASRLAEKEDPKSVQPCHMVFEKD